MATPITIGDATYPRKKDAEAAVRAMVNSAPLETPLTDGNAAFVRGLLARHPHIAEKTGSGVQHFFVRINRVVGRANRGLWIQRTDGTEIDFSWWECLRPSSHRQRVLNAMRAAIQPDMLRFKREAFSNADPPVCALTGEPIAFDACDVHHDPPFLDLVDRFLCGDYDAVRVDVGKTACQFGDRLADDDIRQAWTEYHRHHATLHLVSRDAHQRLTRSTDQCDQTFR